MNRLKYSISLIMILLFTAGIISAQSPEELMQAGNKYYQNEQWDKAISSFEEILTQGYESPAVYYNLGNAYYKTGQLGEAVLNYERADKLAPGDEDIQFNLKIANAHTVDKIKDVPQLFIVEWWNQLVSSLGINGWAAGVVIIFILLLISIGLYFLSKNLTLQKLGIYSGIVSAAVLILSVIILIAAINRETSSDYGILLTDIATAKASPDEQSSDAFVIHEGLKFEIQDKVQDWTKIKLNDGTVGWLPNSTFEKI